MLAGDKSVFDIIKLPIALQSLGLMMEVDSTKENQDTISVDLELFLRVVCACMEDPHWSVTEIQEAFLVFDRWDSGVAEMNDFKRVLTKLGETLSDKEIEDQIELNKSGKSQKNPDNTNYEVQIPLDDFVHLCKNTEGKELEMSEELDS